jgi:hypothetical protein
MAELLAVVALRKAVLSPVCLHSDCYVQRSVKRKISWNFAVLGKVMRNKGGFLDRVPSYSDRRVVDICLTLMMKKPRSISPLEMSCAGVFRVGGVLRP